MKCTENSCNAEATHAAKIMVPAKGWAIDEHQPMSCIFGMRFCLEHARGFRLKETLALNCKGNLRRVFEILSKGKCPPDFDRAFVTAIRLDSPEYVEFESMRRQR